MRRVVTAVVDEKYNDDWKNGNAELRSRLDELTERIGMQNLPTAAKSDAAEAKRFLEGYRNAPREKLETILSRPVWLGWLSGQELSLCGDSQEDRYSEKQLQLRLIEAAARIPKERGVYWADLFRDVVGEPEELRKAKPASGDGSLLVNRLSVLVSAVDKLSGGKKALDELKEYLEDHEAGPFLNELRSIDTAKLWHWRCNKPSLETLIRWIG